MFEPIKKGKLYATVVRQILGSIQNGELRTGDRLPTERELVARLQVSRPTIREALRSMESMGYIESRVGGGTFIKPIDLENVLAPFAVMLTQNNIVMEELFEVRIPLECETAKLAARRIDDDKRREIRAALEMMDKVIETGEGALEADNAFHNSLAQAADNFALSVICEMCAELLSKSRETTYEIPGKNERTFAEHRAIFEAIDRGDEESAIAAMRIHLTNARMNFQ